MAGIGEYPGPTMNGWQSGVMMNSGTVVKTGVVEAGNVLAVSAPAGPPVTSKRQKCLLMKAHSLETYLCSTPVW